MLEFASRPGREQFRRTVVLIVAVLTLLASISHSVSAAPVALAPTSPVSSPVSLEGARWIWYPESVPIADWPAATRYLRRTFTAPAGPYTDAQLVITGDDTVDVWLNGTYLGGSTPAEMAWQSALYIDLAGALKGGTNTLRITARNANKGNAGVLGHVHIATAAATVDLVTDKSWQAANSPRGAWVTVRDLGAYGVAPWNRDVAAPDTGSVQVGVPNATSEVFNPTSEVPNPTRDQSKGFIMVSLLVMLLIGVIGGASLGSRYRTRVLSRRAFQARLRHEATHDALTGLPNRRLMQEKLDSWLRSDPVAVLFLDLNRFKPVNDTYGHEAGDELLRQIADRLSGCIREGDLLARVGGDEFVVLMPGVTYRPDADIMSHQVRLALEHPFKVLGNDIVIGASVGVHLATTNDDPDQALCAADQAMYAVKDLGGGRRAPRPVAGQRELTRVGRHRPEVLNPRDVRGQAPPRQPSGPQSGR